MPWELGGVEGFMFEICRSVGPSCRGRWAPKHRQKEVLRINMITPLFQN